MIDLSIGEPQPNDETLIGQVQQQDQVAFAQLYDRYAQTVFALAAHLLGVNDAEEVTQEIFLRLWRHAKRFDVERGRFRPWFMMLARRRILDELKSRSNAQRMIVLEEIEQLLANYADSRIPRVDPMMEQLWTQQRTDAMQQALHNLPAEQRHALIMAYFGGLSQSEIAAELGLPHGTVKKRIRLGLQKLRYRLFQWRPEKDDTKNDATHEVMSDAKDEAKDEVSESP